MNIKIPQKRIGDKLEFDQEYSLYSGKLIGQGSFGSVYRCRSREDNIEWAIKIIEVPNREESKDLTERELSIYLQMDSHPNIIKVKRLYQWNNDVTHKVAAAIVQELADKGLYDEFIQRKKTGMSYTEEEIIQFLSQSVSGLSFLMKKNGIFHRDIKTENILLKNGQIKITDFGISKSIQQQKIKSLQANTIAGTPLFFSPKVWDAYIKRNESTVVHDLQKSDIFSLGLVFLQVALLLGNNEIAGINQPDGNKQLFSILRRIRSNRLRAVLFGMLAYEETQRLDYDQISKILAMKDSDFDNIRQNQLQFIDPRPPVIQQINTPAMLSPPVKQIIMPVQPLILKNPCFKHNKEADYFCEMDNCYERLCIDCRISHPITHASKILPFNAAVQKYIETNPLQSTFQRINSSLSTDIKGKVQQMQGKYREEIQKAGNELKKQALVAIDQALNKWTQEVSQRLNNTSRDADMIYQQLKGEEKQLLDGQQRYKQSVDNFVYLQMIAKQQQISEKSIQSISDNLARVKGDVERLSKIDQIFLNTFNSVFSFTKNLQSSLDGFFKDLLLNEPMELQIKNVPGIGIYAETPNNRPVVNQIRLQSPQQQQLIRYQFPVAQSPQYVQNVNRQQPQFVNQFQVGKQPGRAVSSDQKAQQQVKKDLQGDIPESVQISPVKEFYSAPGILQDLIFIDSSKNKKLLIASQSDGKIIKVQLHNEERSEIQLTDLKIKSAIYIRSLKKIVCGCQDGRVFLFDPFNMKIVDTPFKESQNSPILCLIYIEKKQQLFTGSQDGQVVLWNLEKKSLERVFQRMHLGEVKGIITNFIDEHLITVGSDKNIIVTEISTNKTLFKVPNAHNSFITAIVKVKENSFFTAGADGFVKLWEWRDKEICLIGQAKLHASPITFLGFLDKYNLLITSSEDGQLHLTDPINYQQVVSALPKGLKGGAKGVHWVSPHLFSSDAFSLLKWENPKLTQCMAMVLKSRKQSQNSNCSIF